MRVWRDFTAFLPRPPHPTDPDPLTCDCSEQCHMTCLNNFTKVSQQVRWRRPARPVEISVGRKVDVALLTSQRQRHARTRLEKLQDI